MKCVNGLCRIFNSIQTLRKLKGLCMQRARGGEEKGEVNFVEYRKRDENVNNDERKIVYNVNAYKELKNNTENGE